MSIFVLCTIVGCRTSQDFMKKESAITTFYVGTYTGELSEGIYKNSLGKIGTLTKIRLIAKTNNHTFLAKSLDLKFLLAVNEIGAEDAN